MSSPNSDLYEFGPYRLDVRRRVFTRNEQAVPLAPKTFELLLLLLRNPGRAFSKHELMTALWPDTFVEEANLSFQISMLRKALGDSGARWIETVPKHGYRFAGDVNPTRPAADSSLQGAVPTAPPRLRVRRWSTRNGWMAGAAAALLGLTSYVTLGPHRTATGKSHATTAVPLTAYQGFENAPSLSPDGSQVAFSWNGPTQDNFAIYVKLAGPGEPYPLTSDPARDDYPAWSPDGRRIAFQRFTSEISADLFVIPALGGAERKLATISVQRQPGIARRVIGNTLSWTPNGKWNIRSIPVTGERANPTQWLPRPAMTTRPRTHVTGSDSRSRRREQVRKGSG
jgi:DNA-binding winged helix-turn-helix (wHTH) protein